MNNSVNILLQSFNWGRLLLISTVASQSSPKHLDFLVFCTSLWQNNKLKLKQYVWTPMPTERLILISSASWKIPPKRCWSPLYRPFKIYTCEGEFFIYINKLKMMMLTITPHFLTERARQLITNPKYSWSLNSTFAFFCKGNGNCCNCLSVGVNLACFYVVISHLITRTSTAQA